MDEQSSDFLLLVTNFLSQRGKPLFWLPLPLLSEGFTAVSAEQAVSCKLWSLRDPLQSKVWVFLDELKQQVN